MTPPPSAQPDARYLARLLVALAALCLLALSLWAEPHTNHGADINRDRLLLGVRR